jgi:hypothetical protein
LLVGGVIGAKKENARPGPHCVTHSAIIFILGTNIPLSPKKIFPFCFFLLLKILDVVKKKSRWNVFPTDFSLSPPTLNVIWKLLCGIFLFEKTK